MADTVKMQIKDIRPLSAYVIQLKTQYEERAVSESEAPYSKGPVDNAGTPAELWDIVVEKPKDFEDRAETIPILYHVNTRACPRGAGPRCF